MSRLARAAFLGAAALVALTGLGYGWTRYFGARLTEFGPEAHPWQAPLQHAHVLAGPAAVFMLGWMVAAHGLPAYRAGGRTGRRSGILLGLGGGALALSGSLVQVAVEPRVRTVLGWIHGGLALAALAGGAAHLLVARRLRPGA
ncbi:MAG TPA: hypothetical protein VK188_05285 [Holophaga sp.]|nr:hypothetical protein [Holophaga sp.]